MTNISLANCLLDRLTIPASEEEDNESLDPGQAIADLAHAGVTPSVFHHEEGRLRFSGLMACKPTRISLFQGHLDEVAHHILSIPTEEIVRRLKLLYEKAYRYDPAAQTMDVVDQQAKRELDLWIAAIDHEAYQNENFLKRVHVPEVRRILALNSPHLTPAGRGADYRLEHGLMSPRQCFERGVKATVAWARSYDGRTFDFLETPFWRSRAESWESLEARLGQKEATSLSLESFSQDAVLRILASTGWMKDYRRLSGLPDRELIHRITDIWALTFTHPGPLTMRNIAKEFVLISLVMNSRGEDLTKAIRESLVQDNMTTWGLTKEDAELAAGADRPHQVTASRLDNYEIRFRYLAKFREIYRDFLKAPIEQRFSPERAARYNLWTQFMLNHAASGATMTLSDIDRIRREVLIETPQQTDGPISWDEFSRRDPERPLWLRPSDLGVLSDPWSDPFSVAQMLPAPGGSLADFVARNVDFIAVLPDRLMPTPHVLGLAFGLFGAMILRNEDVGENGNRTWTPGSFWEVTAHEAGHNYWARENFDEHPEKLPWLAANERMAYLIGNQAALAYGRSDFADPSEGPLLQNMTALNTMRIRVANRRLELNPNDMTLRFDSDRWRNRRADFFAFQPGHLIAPDGSEVGFALEEARRLSPTERTRVAAALIGRGLHLLRGPFPIPPSGSGEAKEVLDTLSDLNHLSPDALSPTFGRYHPFLDWINAIERELELPPLRHVTFSGSSWKDFWDARVGAYAARLKISRIQDQAWADDKKYLPEWVAQESARLGLNDTEKKELEDQVSMLNDRTDGDGIGPVEIAGKSPLGRALKRRLEKTHTPSPDFFWMSATQWRSTRLTLLKEIVGEIKCKAHAEAICTR